MEEFCRFLLAPGGDEDQVRRTENQAAFLTAILGTFKLESREGRNYLSLAPVTPDSADTGAAARLRRRRNSERARARVLSRTILASSLGSEDIFIRVTQCEREQEYIKICFHLKRDEDKVYGILRDLNNNINCLEKPPYYFKGLVCAAPCEGDLRREGNVTYGRAIVVSSVRRDDREVEVRFLDLGFVDFVDKSSLRKLPKKFLKCPALSHEGVVLNTCTDRPSERESEAYRMVNSPSTKARVVRFNKKKNFYEVFVYRIQPM